jgi:hypothetical protein
MSFGHPFPLNLCQILQKSFVCFLPYYIGIAFAFMGKKLAPFGPFFFSFQPRFFISFIVWPLLPKIYNDTGLVKVRYVMRKNFHSVSLWVQEILLKRSKVGLRNSQNQIET